MKILRKNKKMSGKPNNSLILIFDFDGTIVDTKALYYNVIFKQLKNFGFSYSQVDDAVDMGETLKKMLGKLGFSKITSWYINRKILKNIKKELKNVEKCRDVDEIKKLNNKNSGKRNIKKILVSNSLKALILPILKNLRLKKEFKEIYGAEDFSSKTEFVEEYLKNENLSKKDKKHSVYYVGDRATDVKLARKCKINSVIVIGKCAWDSRAEILKENPDFIIHSLKDLKEVIKKNNF